jgi:nucleotide-binding universal stress UspA family protein
MTRIRRMLCASDFSTTSSRALTVAIGLARTIGARLTIVYAHVPIAPLVPEQVIDSITLNRLDREARRWVERHIAGLVRRASKAGTHGRRGTSKFLLGSVAERVIATAPCPVLTVRGK